MVAVLKAPALLTRLSLRECRHAVALSQSQFAAQLGVPLET
jgi:DNA-binding transcriptional regulator YiaG